MFRELKRNGTIFLLLFVSLNVMAQDIMTEVIINGNILYLDNIIIMYIV